MIQVRWLAQYPSVYNSHDTELMRHRPSRSIGMQEPDSLFVLNTQKRDRRTIEEIQAEMKKNYKRARVESHHEEEQQDDNDVESRADGSAPEE